MSNFKDKDPNDSKWLPENARWCDPWREDWRCIRQEGFLVDKVLQRKRLTSYDTNEYDPAQCVFCYECLRRRDTAYYEPVGKVWICEKCYADFQRYFDWTYIDTDAY